MVDETIAETEAQAASLAADVSAGRRRGDEGQGVGEAVADMTDAVLSGSKDLGKRAARRLDAEAGSLKDDAAAGLTTFSDALKSASDELSGKRLGFAGDMVSQAATGLETLARSLERRSPAEMLEEIRSFGRQNPVGFVAGSVLAGFALGRVAAATSAGTSAPSRPAGADPEGALAP